MLKRLFIILLLCLTFLLASPVRAQAPTPTTPADTLILAIQERARQDVALDKPLASISDLQVLFGDQAAAAGMPMVQVVSVYEAAYQEAKGAQPWWQGLTDALRPNAGWIVAAVVAVLALLGKVIEDYLKRFFNWLFEALYRALARYQPFWWWALRRYRQALERAHKELKIPFRQGKPLQMQDVYVPLQVSGQAGDEKTDALQALQKHQRLVVLGAPGAGKTMLIRHLALTYARHGLEGFPDQPVPVLLELHRLNDAGTLLEQMTNALALHDFPGAERFLKAMLERGSLLLLFDGLDEVSAAGRGQAVQKIKDLLRQYPKNRAVVTCRSAVYKGELADWADQQFSVAEFDDQQMQRFLLAWEADMPEGKSAQHFLRALRERPQIMALARNPLLLTMVAYLYTDTEFVLPHSRTEFYTRSTGLLLEQWKLERNRYKVANKRLVLQHLALYNQAQGGQAGGDRRSLDLPTALVQVKAVLPSLMLKDEDAQPLLDEIVERSGLLLAIDGGAFYQFTHLTLQEFFAAQALEAQPEVLLNHFIAHPDDWREVLRLWCGLEHNSTPLIRRVHEVDPVMALECLAESQKIDPAFARGLLDEFKIRLPEAARDEKLRDALALAAADPRPRGQEMLAFLIEQLKIPVNELAAAAVLARSNLHQAAEALAELACEQPMARPYLLQMGDLAVHPLTNWAGQGQEWAMDGLVEIGTPKAALALRPLIFMEENLAYRAAWRLAALLPQPGVETILRAVELTPEERKAPQIEWVWSPFDEPPASPVPVIAGRIAHLLCATSEQSPPEKKLAIDVRLVVPLCAIVAQGDQIIRISETERDKTNTRVFGVEGADHLYEDKSWRYLFASLPPKIQSNLFTRLITDDPRPNINDWRYVFRPFTYEIDTSWQVRGMKLMLVILLLLNVFGAWDIIRRSGVFWSWANGAIILSVICTVLIVIALLMQGKWVFVCIEDEIIVVFLAAIPGIGISFGLLSRNWLVGALAGCFIGCLAALPKMKLENVLFLAGIGLIHGLLAGLYANGCFDSILGVTYLSINVFQFFMVRDLVVLLIIIIILFKWDSLKIVAWLLMPFIIYLIVIGTIYIPTKYLYEIAKWPAIMLFWIIWSGCVVILQVLARSSERRARNPLYGLLGKPSDLGMLPDHAEVPFRFFYFHRIWKR